MLSVAVDSATEELISQGARFLGILREGFVTEAVRSYLEQRREEIRRAMADSLTELDGSLLASVVALTGLSADRIKQLGGADRWDV